MRRPMWVRGLLWVSLTSPLLVTGLAWEQAPSRPPKVWAIVVGVGNYGSPAIVDRRTPVRDANLIYRWIGLAGWDERHRILLSDAGNTDPGEPDAPALNILPTKRNLDWAFQRWLLTPKVQAGDIVVFYFAGESRTVVKPQGARLDPRVEHYLLPVDALAENIEQTGWSLDEAVAACVRRRLQVVCWLATAPDDRRGPLLPPPPPIPPAAGRPPTPAPARPRVDLASGVNWLSRLARWPGVTAWLAADRPGRLATVVDPGATFTRRCWRPSASPTPIRAQAEVQAEPGVVPPRPPGPLPAPAARVLLPGRRPALDDLVAPGEGTAGAAPRAGHPGRARRQSDGDGFPGGRTADPDRQPGLDGPRLVGAGSVAAPGADRAGGGCQLDGPEPGRSLGGLRRQSGFGAGLRSRGQLRPEATQGPPAARLANQPDRLAPRRPPLLLGRHRRQRLPLGPDRGAAVAPALDARRDLPGDRLRRPVRSRRPEYRA